MDEIPTAPSSRIPPLPELDFCKCGKGKCPKIKLLESGGIQVSDDDAGAKPVELTPAQASELKEWLSKHGF